MVENRDRRGIAGTSYNDILVEKIPDRLQRLVDRLKAIET